MEMQAVTSSNIESIGYDAATETMRVKFKSGGVYDYSGVQEATYYAVLMAPSIGSWVARYIKGKYESRKVE